MLEALTLAVLLSQPPRVDFDAYIAAHPIALHVEGPQAPTKRQRLDVALLTTSISACSVALGLTR